MDISWKQEAEFSHNLENPHLPGEVLPGNGVVAFNTG